MRRAFVRAALACIAIAFAAAFDGAAAQAPATVAAQSPPLAGIALRDALRRGGFVLYFRHTSTDFGQNDDGDDVIRRLHEAAQPHRQGPRRSARDRRRRSRA